MVFPLFKLPHKHLLHTASKGQVMYWTVLCLQSPTAEFSHWHPSYLLHLTPLCTPVTSLLKMNNSVEGLIHSMQCGPLVSLLVAFNIRKRTSIERRVTERKESGHDAPLSCLLVLFFSPSFLLLFLLPFLIFSFSSLWCYYGQNLRPLFLLILKNTKWVVTVSLIRTCSYYIVGKEKIIWKLETNKKYVLDLRMLWANTH